MTERTTKVCARCKQEKPITDFNKSVKQKDGLQSYCKECKKSYSAAHYISVKSQHSQSATQPHLTEFDAFQPREIIAQIRERINYLRSKGWEYEGQLSYTETKIVKL